MDQSFLDAEVTEQPEVTVKDITIQQVTVRNDIKEKCMFICTTADGRDLKISDVHVEDSSGERKVQGLWWNKNISPGSSVYKVLKFYNVTKLRDLIGTKVKVMPDHNDFLILTACNMPVTPTKGELFN